MTSVFIQGTEHTSGGESTEGQNAATGTLHQRIAAIQYEPDAAYEPDKQFEPEESAPATATRASVAAQQGYRPGSVNARKLEKRLRRNIGKAIGDFSMIEEGDRVMVCLSGGKDSYVMLDMLLRLQASAPIRFSLLAVNLDQKQPGFPEHVLPAYLKNLGVDYRIIERDTYSVVREKIPEGKTTCGLCSRLRRGILYNFAEAEGCSKIALGHHRDDILETLFLNMFFGAKLSAMPPKLKSDDGRNVVIRPLAYCAETDLQRYATLREFPIIPCNLCGSQENLQRQSIKQMLRDWEAATPGRLDNMFAALQNIAPSQLCDTALFDFHSLRADQSAGA